MSRAIDVSRERHASDLVVEVTITYAGVKVVREFSMSAVIANALKGGVPMGAQIGGEIALKAANTEFAEKFT